MNNSKQETTINQASQFMRDFMTLQLRFSQLPLDLAKVRNLIDEIRFGNGSKRYNVFVVVYRIMEQLHTNETLTMGELSRAVSLPLSTTTRMVDFLVNIGECQRFYDPNDRRVVRVTLTDVGRRNLQTSEKYIVQRGREILSALSDEEQTNFLSLFSKVATAIRESEGTP